jgi:hypothetical protein
MKRLEKEWGEKNGEHGSEMMCPQRGESVKASDVHNIKTK